MVIIVQYLRAWSNITITYVGAWPTRGLLRKLAPLVLIFTLILIKIIIAGSCNNTRILALLKWNTSRPPNIRSTSRINVWFW